MDHLANRYPETWTTKRLFANYLGSLSGGPIVIHDDLRIEGDVHVEQNLTIEGTSLFNDDVTIDANLHVTETLTVDGTSTFNDDVTIDANLHVTEALTVDGTSTFNDDMTMNNTSTLVAGNLNVTGTASLNDDLSVGDTLHVTGNLAVDGDATFDGVVTANSDLVVAGTTTATDVHLTGDLEVDGQTTLSGWVLSMAARVGEANYDLAGPWSDKVPSLHIYSLFAVGSEFALLNGSGSRTNPNAPDCPHITSLTVDGPANRSVIAVYNATQYPMRFVVFPDSGNFAAAANIRSVTGCGPAGIDPALKSVIWFPGQRCMFLRSLDAPNDWLPLIDDNWRFSYSVQNNTQVSADPLTNVVNQVVTFTTSRHISPGPGGTADVQIVITMHYVADLSVVVAANAGGTPYVIDIPWPWLPGNGASSWPTQFQLPWIKASPVQGVVAAYTGTPVTVTPAPVPGMGSGAPFAWFGPAPSGPDRGVLQFYHGVTIHPEEAYSVHIDFSCPVTINCANPLVLPSV